MRKCLFLLILTACMVMLAGCASGAETAPESTPEPVRDTPAIPEKLQVNEQGIPIVKVYDMDEEIITEMDLETYLMGVVAGEMKNDWPLEALKAQAVLARTFVLKFVDEKESKYPEADISTDIEEAQAYDRNAVNDSIRQAVADTQGMVLSAEGQLPYAWFHAHSGGMMDGNIFDLDIFNDDGHISQSRLNFAVHVFIELVAFLNGAFSSKFTEYGFGNFVDTRQDSVRENAMFAITGINGFDLFRCDMESDRDCQFCGLLVVAVHTEGLAADSLCTR